MFSNSKHDVVRPTSTSEDYGVKAPLTECVIKPGDQNSGFANICSTARPFFASSKVIISNLYAHNNEGERNRYPVESENVDPSWPKENFAPVEMFEGISNDERLLVKGDKAEKTSTFSHEISIPSSYLYATEAPSSPHACHDVPPTICESFTRSLHPKVACILPPLSVDDDEDEELKAIFEYTQGQRGEKVSSKISAKSMSCGRRNPAIPKEESLMTELEDRPTSKLMLSDASLLRSTNVDSMHDSSATKTRDDKAVVKVIHPTDIAEMGLNDLGRKDVFFKVIRPFDEISPKSTVDPVTSFPSLVTLR